MSDKTLVQGSGIELTEDPVANTVTVSLDPTAVLAPAVLLNATDPTKGSGAIDHGPTVPYASGTLGYYVQQLLAFMSSSSTGIAGPAGPPGTSSYLHIRYSDDGGATFTASGGTAIGSYLGTYTDSNPTASTSVSSYTWAPIRGAPGATGNFIDHVFQRSATQPATPTGNGTPSGWFDGPPADDGNPLWMTTATKTAANVLVGVWSAPTAIGGVAGAGVVIEYSVDGSSGWHSTFTAGDLYAHIKIGFGAFGQAFRIVGEQGAAGATGPQGPQGNQGIQGPAGSNGVSTYFHTAYASSPDGSVGFNFSSGTYIGTYVDSNATSSSAFSSYTWRQFVGAQGPQGTQGIPGASGANGQTEYLHIKYSNDGGTTFTASAGEVAGAYIGQRVDFVSADSNTPSDYTWALIQGATGPQGIQGATGANGQPTYLHIRWSNDGGATFTASGGTTPGAYIGTYTDSNSTASSTVGSYTWALIKGADGTQGIQGPPGPNGQATYVHVKWSNDGGLTFTANGGETAGTYIGVCTDTNASDPTVVGPYTWALVQGAPGSPGSPGTPGANGTSVYVATVYQQSTGTPTAPTGGSFNFSNSTLTPPTGWTDVAPNAGLLGPVYSTRYTFTATSPGATVVAGTWSEPVNTQSGAVSVMGDHYASGYNHPASGTTVTSIATIQISADGSIYSSGSNSLPASDGSWYAPNTPNIGNNFQIRFDIDVAASPTGVSSNALGAWTTMTTNMYVRLQFTSSASFTQDSSGSYAVRRLSDGVQVGGGRWYLTVSGDPPGAIP